VNRKSRYSTSSETNAVGFWSSNNNLTRKIRNEFEPAIFWMGGLTMSVYAGDLKMETKFDEPKNLNQPSRRFSFSEPRMRKTATPVRTGRGLGAIPVTRLGASISKPVASISEGSSASLTAAAFQDHLMRRLGLSLGKPLRTAPKKVERVVPPITAEEVVAEVNDPLALAKPPKLSLGKQWWLSVSWKSPI
jgi:hypothetical protein